MISYMADNQKRVVPDKMDLVESWEDDGCYGAIDTCLYRTRKTHEWYEVSESSWNGEGSVSSASHLTPREVVEALTHRQWDDDQIRTYPELIAALDAIEA